MPYDLIIIGGGPAGLTAGLYAASHRMKTLLLEAGEGGGQPASLYPEKVVENFPGTMNVKGRDLVQQMLSQTMEGGCEVHNHERVHKIEGAPGDFKVTSDLDVHRCKLLILALGAGQYRPKRLGAPGEDRLKDKGVHYKLPDRFDLVGKRLLFVGGGNSALGLALNAAEVAEVHILHRKETFRADAQYVEKVKESGIKTYLGAEVLEIKGKERVESVVVRTPQGTEELAMDMVIINIGFAPELEDLKHWGLEVQDGLIVVDQEMRTSRKGILACGDVVIYPGKYRQIITACGEAAIAVNAAFKELAKPYWA